MKKRKGFFIVLDGIDGSGKATQTALLAKRLKAKGYTTETIDFPRYYDNFFGKLIGKYLTGELGSCDPHIISAMYALDRWESKDIIERNLAKGKIFICDRYASANMIHQGGRIKNARQRQEMIKWLEKMEFGIFGIPKPNLILYLDVLPEIGQKLVDKKNERAYTKGRKRDIYEKNIEHLINARKTGVMLARKKKEWKKINCIKNGKLLGPEAINDLIWKEVEKSLDNNYQLK